MTERTAFSAFERDSISCSLGGKSYALPSPRSVHRGYSAKEGPLDKREWSVCPIGLWCASTTDLRDSPYLNNLSIRERRSYNKRNPAYRIRQANGTTHRHTPP